VTRAACAFLLLVACGRAPAPPPYPDVQVGGAGGAALPQVTPLGPAAQPDAAATGALVLHLAIAGPDEGVTVTAPERCERVDGHTFSSTAADLRLHLNASPCPTGAGCASLVAWLDGPEARASRKGGEVVELRAVGEDRAVLVVRNPVLDTASVIMTDPGRRVLVACSAQAGHDAEVDAAIVAACLGVTIAEVRPARAGELSAPSHALLCHPPAP